MRETLFNWLGQDLGGLACLDLFAGSGALGFEALSRGAARATLVERDPAAVRALRENAALLDATAAEVVQRDAHDFLRADSGRYDLILVDPPYGQGWLDRLLPLLAGRLNPGGRVYAEEQHEPQPGPGWEVLRRCRAGAVHAVLMRPAA